MRRIAVLLAVGALITGACSSTSTAPEERTTPGTSGAAPPSAPVDYSGPGPYLVGSTEIGISTDPCPEEPEGCERNAVVYYPADPDAAAASTRIEGYSTALAFPEAARAVLPPEFLQQIDLDHVAVHDGPVAHLDAPFPVVLQSHGFAGFYLFESRFMSHLASWGFVVASPDHKERSLGGLLGGPAFEEGRDVEDLRNTLAALRNQNVEEGGVLYGAMDFDQVAATGHSAGGGASGRLAADAQIDTWIGKASGPPVAGVRFGDPSIEDLDTEIQRVLDASPPPAIPTMLIAAADDEIVPLRRNQALYNWLEAPKRLVVLANAGHNAFTDLCAPIRAQGGLMQFVDQVPALVPVLRLGEDGCVEGQLDPLEGEALINHATVAQLRWVFGADADDAALEPAFLRSLFGDALAEAVADPSPPAPAPGG